MRVKLVETILSDLKKSKRYKNLYKNIVPLWTDIPRFPAVSVLYESEHKDLSRLSGNRFYYEGIILIYLFNKQKSANSYEDVLSDFITETYTLIKNNTYLRNNTIDCSVAEMKREGGIVHPYAIAQIKITVKYQQTV